MKQIALTALALFWLAFTPFAHADFRSEVEQASAKLTAAWGASQDKMDAGDFTGANASLLAVFPNADKSAAESFILANALFDVDAKLSYSLHKSAAKLAPDNSNVIWEWGLEQHRAGEYAGALASYQTVSKIDPNTASPHALQADCLLRLNRIVEAVAAWKKSEDAPDGSIEVMEDIVCTVHRPPAPHELRSTLLVKATGQRDAKAAGALIALDCEFPRDWWNTPPNKAYLAHDVPAVMNALKLPADDLRARSILCAKGCALADRFNKAAIKVILTKYKLIIDADNTLPDNVELLSVILAFAGTSENVDTALRQKLGPKILKLARGGKDVALWNDAAYMKAAGTAEEDMKFEREGWQATGDQRFAAVLLRMKAEHIELQLDDPDLVAARKQFPDSSMIQRINYEVALTHNKLTREILADAAKSEFTHFSSFKALATVVNRPRSDYLRDYFKRLEKMPAAKPAEEKGNGK